MNFTVGLLLIFLNLILPGLTFLRFYFTGEFSKQFNTRIPLIRLMFYSFFPGFLIQTIGLFVYNLIDKKFTFYQAIAIILGIAMILNLKETEGNYNVLMAAALVISLFALNIVVAIVVLSILILIGLSVISN
jgi:hypothetical protein